VLDVADVAGDGFVRRLRVNPVGWSIPVLAGGRRDGDEGFALVAIPPVAKMSQRH